MTPAQILLLDECVTRRCTISSTNCENFNIQHTVRIRTLGPGSSDCQIVQYLLRNKQCFFVTEDRELYYICRQLGITCGLYDKGICHVNENLQIELGKHNRRGSSLRINARPVSHCKFVWGIIDLRRSLVRFFKENSRPFSKRRYTKSLQKNRKRVWRKLKKIKCEYKASQPFKTAKTTPRFSSCNHMVKPFSDKQIQALRLVWPKRIKPSYAGLLPIMPFERCVCGQFCHNKTTLRNHVITSHNAELAQCRTLIQK